MADKLFISRLGQRLIHRIQSPLDLYSQPLSRQRRFLLFMGVSACITAACSSNPQTNQPSATEQSSATKLVQHAFGEVEVPANPSRIVVFDYFTVEALMALGAQPIAAPRMIIDNLLHLPPSDHDITDIGNPREPSIEKIATLQPDLILTTKSFTDADTHSLLSQIAPTVVFDVEGYTEWKLVTRLCAEVLGKEAEAEQLKADYEAKLQVFRTQLSGNTSQVQVSVTSFYDDRISTFGKDTFVGTILEDAGLSRPPNQVEESSTQISLELLSDIDGDVLFVMKPQGQTEIADNVRQALEEMKANPLWTQLKAVQTKQVHEVDAYWFGMGYIAANLVLDDLMTYIIEKF
ncbi:MAG: iron-siderophore ABC transporter substrate-binding protein [Symploca sp. SIO2B6]|nr:iron-siderophore ABC transporter substrate-binding protein [Symploca sp. SIO2B6]